MGIFIFVKKMVIKTIISFIKWQDDSKSVQNILKLHLYEIRDMLIDANFIINKISLHHFQ